MASSGTIIGGKDGTRPYLELDWSVTSQDIANNRSTINLKLYLRVTHSIGYNARYTGVLQGSSFTANAGYLSSSGRYLLAQRNITVGHNSNGTKTQNFTASYNIAITWSGTYYSSISLSGSDTLPTIPRGSTLSAFSFANSLQVGTANTINYTVTRHSSTFRHQIQLRDGSVTIATWDNVSSNGSDTLSLTGTQVNTILGRMSTVTSKSFTLRVATRSRVNGGFIGNAVTRNASVSVNSNVEPTISSTSAVPIGNSWAVDKGFYVQGQTGVRAEFSSSASGGAGVRSRNISIGSLSNGGSVVGSSFRHSHTRLNTAGNITITYTITDTRGRTASATRTINVRAYTPPQITSFSAGRSSPTSPTVNVKSNGSIHGMGGQNTGTMTVKQKGVTSPVRTLSLSNTTPSFNDSFNRTVATSTSTDFTITVTDSLGNSAMSTTTVGTAFMELSIRKGTGVGIGKIHEEGVLDVNGAIFSNGVRLDSTETILPSGDGSKSYWFNMTAGAYRLNPNTFTDQPMQYGFVQVYNSMNSVTVTITPMGEGRNLDRTLLLMNFNPASDEPTTKKWRRLETSDGGTNDNGHWMRFGNGIQICSQRSTLQYEGTHALYRWWTFPIEFASYLSDDFVVLGTVNTASSTSQRGGLVNVQSRNGTKSAQIRYQVTSDRPFKEGDTLQVYLFAIGRWRSIVDSTWG